MKNSNSRPIEGCFYWVKMFKDREYEVAKCRVKHDKLYFCFTNGSIAEVDSVTDYNSTPLSYNNSNPSIPNELCSIGIHCTDFNANCFNCEKKKANERS